MNEAIARSRLFLLRAISRCQLVALQKARREMRWATTRACRKCRSRPEIFKYRFAGDAPGKRQTPRSGMSEKVSSLCCTISA